MVVNPPTSSVRNPPFVPLIDMEDVGGGATAKAIEEAFKLITNDPKVTAVFVNIFGNVPHLAILTKGGIVRCDSIAQGLIDTVSKSNMNIPIVARLQGTNMTEANDLVPLPTLLHPLVRR